MSSLRVKTQERIEISRMWATNTSDTFLNVQPYYFSHTVFLLSFTDCLWEKHKKKQNIIIFQVIVNRKQSALPISVWESKTQV